MIKLLSLIFILLSCLPTMLFHQNSRYILHAGGDTPDGIIGSNSVDAAEHSYEKGYRVLEIDFCFTSDDRLVCVHDFKNYYSSSLGKSDITYDEFEEVRHNTYPFTSFTLDYLCEWIRGHRDVIIVTDIKENCVEGARIISEEYHDLKDNFCIQIYSTSDYDAVKKLGFDNIILTLYYMNWNEKTDTDAIVEFAKSHKLAGITFSAEMVSLVEGYVDALLEAGTPLYVHTVNNEVEHQKLFDMGIWGIYTDYAKKSE